MYIRWSELQVTESVHTEHRLSSAFVINVTEKTVALVQSFRSVYDGPMKKESDAKHTVFNWKKLHVNQMDIYHMSSYALATFDPEVHMETALVQVKGSDKILNALPYRDRDIILNTS